MTKKSYSENIRQFGSQYLDETGKAFKLYSQGVEKLLSGKVEGKQVPNRLVNFVKADGDDFIRDVMQAGVDGYLTMMKTGLALGDKFVNTVLDPAPVKRSSHRKSVEKPKTREDDK